MTLVEQSKEAVRRVCGDVGALALTVENQAAEIAKLEEELLKVRQDLEVARVAAEQFPDVSSQLNRLGAFVRRRGFDPQAIGAGSLT
jgi:hypothetical protein